MTPAIVFLPLTLGQVAIIDFEDFERVGRHKWYAVRRKHSFYAQRRAPGNRTFQLSRELLGAGPGTQVDHKDGNGLNDQRSNLRLASPAENQYNKRNLPHSSPFKGVTLDPSTDKWRARLGFKNRVLNLGTFESPEEAARVYDKAASAHFGEFAQLNFP